jgi:hypothetical protein
VASDWAIDLDRDSAGDRLLDRHDFHGKISGSCREIENQI